MTNALYQPSRATSFLCDPTPGRHTAAVPIAAIDNGSAVLAPYPEVHFFDFERYDYRSKGRPSVTASSYWQVGTCAGVCLFPVIFFGNYPLIELLNAAGSLAQRRTRRRLGPRLSLRALSRSPCRIGPPPESRQRCIQKQPDGVLRFLPIAPLLAQIPQSSSSPRFLLSLRDTSLPYGGSYALADCGKSPLP